MSTSTVALEVPEAEDITTTDDILTVELGNGRTIPFPLEWSPRLLHASTKGKEKLAFAWARSRTEYLSALLISSIMLSAMALGSGASLIGHTTTR